MREKAKKFLARFPDSLALSLVAPCDGSGCLVDGSILLRLLPFGDGSSTSAVRFKLPVPSANLLLPIMAGWQQASPPANGGNFSIISRMAATPASSPSRLLVNRSGTTTSPANSGLPSFRLPHLLTCPQRGLSDSMSLRQVFEMRSPGRLKVVLVINTTPVRNQTRNLRFLTINLFLQTFHFPVCLPPWHIRRQPVFSPQRSDRGVSCVACDPLTRRSTPLNLATVISEGLNHPVF